MERQLTELGAQVRAAQDDQLARAVDLERGRQRLLEATGLGARRRRRAVLTLATASLAGIGIWAAAVAYRSGPLRFEVGARGAGEVGAWIATAAGNPTPLRFADGTELVLLPGARSLVEGTRGAPRVVVERGELRASVVPRIGRRWRVDAGPFKVIVTGTRFSLAWDPDLERFSIALHEGKVLVSGPTIGTDRPVAAGETLRVSPREDGLSLRAGRAVAGFHEPAREVLDDAGGAADDTLPEAPRLRPHRTPPVTHGPPATPDPAGFVRLARDNRYADALAAAEAQGFERLCQTTAAADLLLLGDAARLAGSSARARDAYTAVRDRGSGAAAAHATFLLGRLALYERSEPAAAARLFEAYLREHPSGPFAREASGLLAEARSKAGDVSGARAAARDYLERYPEGPFVARARALQGGE